MEAAEICFCENTFPQKYLVCHSAHVTRFHFVLPRFVQVQPGVYEAGSHLHQIPNDKKGH